ncbi:MAG: PRD domain-containing protein [Erysipelotrichaceae bacterium]|nr:PRD domain-containing protein [Erysipelotrichaceae bacterium]
MVVLSKRETMLIQRLAQTQGYVSQSELCEFLEIKPRTLRECIRSFRNSFQSQAGIDIESGIGIGYRLVVKDKDKYYAFQKEMLNSLVNEQTVISGSQDDRVKYMIRVLLSAKKPVRTEQLADRMYIARSTIADDLKKVREQLADFQLTLKTIYGEGVRVEGDERNIREAIAHTLISEPFNNHEAELMDLYFEPGIRNIAERTIHETLNKYDYHMADAGFRYLLIHILVAISRIRTETYIDDSSGKLSELKQMEEWKIAEDIYSSIGKQLQLEIPESEIGYVTIHLAGKRMIVNENELILYPETLNMLVRILDAVKVNYHYDFLGDTDLFAALAMHIQPLLHRAKFGLHISNPMLETIMTKNSLAFDMGTLAADEIIAQTGYAVDKNEIGYMALHFALAIEKNRYHHRKKILVVCASGAGTSRILEYRLRNALGTKNTDIMTAGYYELEKDPHVECDLILSTVPIPFATDAKVIRIHELPDFNELNSVERSLYEDETVTDQVISCLDERLFFRDMSFASRHDAIHFLCDQLSRTTDLPDVFEESVLKRERFAATTVGNGVAMPHPDRLISNQIGLAVCHLKTPLKWGKDEVSLIILFNMKTEEDDLSRTFSEMIADFVSSRDKITRYMKNPEYITLTEILKEYSGNKEEDFFR